MASRALLDAALGAPARLAALAGEGLGMGEPAPIFDRFARLAARSARSPMAFVSLVELDRDRLVGMCGIPQPWADAREVPLSHSFCKHVVANRAPLIVEDARTDPVLGVNPAIVDLGVVAYAGFPITTSAGQTLGGLCAADRDRRVWEEPDLESLSDIAGLVAGELDRRGMVRRLSVEARTDPLTGLANRRTWNDELPHAARRAKRLGHSLAVALFDLDHFEAFNARHGHLAGDQALLDVTESWRRHVRDIDLLARLGGVEFGLLLPGCDADTAMGVANRLLAATPHGLTASAGVSYWGAALTADQLVALADRALYQAKRDGRDRVVLLEPGSRPPRAD